MNIVVIINISDNTSSSHNTSSSRITIIIFRKRCEPGLWPFSAQLLRGIVVSANLCDTCWSLHRGKGQSPRFSAKHPQELRRIISKSWLAKFPTLRRTRRARRRHPARCVRYEARATRRTRCARRRHLVRCMRYVARATRRTRCARRRHLVRWARYGATQHARLAAQMYDDAQHFKAHKLNMYVYDNIQYTMCRYIYIYIMLHHITYLWNYITYTL